MDIAEALEGTGQKVTLVTLDPVSSFDSHNLSSGRPESVDYWINAYVGKGVFDMAGVVPIAGQLVAGVGTLITGGGRNNTVASLGGKWGHESGADVNIKFPFYGKIDHGYASSLFSEIAPRHTKSAQQYLQDYIRQ